MSITLRKSKIQGKNINNEKYIKRKKKHINIILFVWSYYIMDVFLNKYKTTYVYMQFYKATRLIVFVVNEL